VAGQHPPRRGEGHRRFRKGQKSISKVRTQPHLQQRLALDLYRDLWAAIRDHTLEALHRARAQNPYSVHRPGSDPDSDHCCCLRVSFSCFSSVPP
jgi:hypothetical protein